MPFSETIRIALNALRTNKLRSVLTILGVTIGVFSGDRRDDGAERDPGIDRVGPQFPRQQPVPVRRNIRS
jgi:hypothetical protein